MGRVRKDPDPRRAGPFKIAVLMGGPSSEREVSMRSGRAVAEALRGRSHEVAEVVLDGERVPDLGDVDAVFIALHGTFGEDGSVQEILESRGLPYTGPGPLASRRAMDKSQAKALFAEAGLSVAAHVTVNAGDEDDAARIEELLGWPAVVKPVSQGSSIGVAIVRGPEALQDAVTSARSFDAEVFAEAFVAGREFTVGVLDGVPLPPVELRPHRTFYDYEAKYTAGNTEYVVGGHPEAVTRALQEAALLAYRALGCEGMGRVDMILPDGEGAGGPVVLELNTIPGFTATSLLPKAAAAAGIGFGELCERLVLLAIERAARGRKARRAG